MTVQEDYKVLIIDEAHPLILERLSRFNVSYRPDVSLEELPSLLGDIDVLILRTKLQFSQAWIEQAPKLKFIGRLGSGLDNIDTIFAEKRGIHCANAPEGNRNAVAEQALGTILAVLHNIHASANEVKQGVWDRKNNEGVELSEMTIGVIGYGHAGKQFARLVSSFSTRVLAVDPNVKEGDEFAQMTTLEEVQQEADLITFHPSLNPTSFHLFDDAFLANMVKPFYLFNFSRGPVINTSTIISGLTNGKILGCGLDVLENEKLSTYSKEEAEILSQLTDYKQVVITPHTAGLTKNSFRKIAEVMAEKVLKWADEFPFIN